MSITQTCCSKHNRKKMHTNKSVTATEIDWMALTGNARLPKCMMVKRAAFKHSHC